MMIFRVTLFEVMNARVCAHTHMHTKVLFHSRSSQTYTSTLAKMCSDKLYKQFDMRAFIYEKLHNNMREEIF